MFKKYRFLFSFFISLFLGTLFLALASRFPLFAQSSVITFDTLSNPNTTLNGQYPTGVADWGSGKWFLSGPWNLFTTNSISFDSSSSVSQTVTFITPVIITSVDAYNGGTGSSTISLSCAGNSTISQNVLNGTKTTISTGWTASCSTLTIGSTNGWWTNFDNLSYSDTPVTPTPTPAVTPSTTPTPTTTPIPTVTPTPVPTSTPTPTPGNGPLLVYHNIVTDGVGKILPWYSSDLGTSYDHVINLVWNYWVSMPNMSNGIPKYLQHRMASNNGSIGGDQLSMALSSWQLLYQYSGNQSVLNNMTYIADFYLDHGLSSSTSLWPNLPYPSNQDGINPVTPTFYNGDLIAGVGVTQPDKAGAFGAELVTLYKITGTQKYLDAAVAIANTLASKTTVGNATVSPLPYRVNATTGVVLDAYTSNWTGTLRLFDGLIALNQGNVSSYSNARTLISNWLKTYPMVTHAWGPFFEDITGYSDTEVNADTLATYILENPSWDTTWQVDARNILNSTATQFGDPNWDGVNWSSYGVLPIDEQTQYMVPGNSHTARHSSVEVMYAEKTGDTTKKSEAIRGLSWATYMVDVDGKNLYPTNDIWLTDGYGDYVRHYLRAMAAAPEIAPSSQNHILRSTSVVKTVSYLTNQVNYSTFDASATEVLKLNFVPIHVYAGGVELLQNTNLNQEGWTFDTTSNVLSVRHNLSGQIAIQGVLSTPAPSTGVHLAIMSDSSSDEYRADDNRAGSTQYAATTLAWSELLSQKRSLDLGVWGTRSEPRRSGYEFNWARSGAQAADLISSGQNTGVVSQVQNGLINIVYFQIGNNDFAYYRDGAAIYNGTISGTALTDKLNAYVANVTTALDSVLSSNSSIKVILGNLADPGQIPYWQSQFPDSSKRQLVTDAINTVNAQLTALASARPRVTLFDQQAFAQTVLSRVDAFGNLVVGGDNISMTVNGDEPHHATIGDNIHGGTVLEGIFANEIIKRINTMLGTTISEFTDAELLLNAGIVPPTPTPTPTPTTTPTPVPTPTPTPIPSPTPTPTPTPVPTPTPTPVPTPTPTPTPTPIPGTTITFNDMTNPNRNFSGQYPTGVINWGTNQWYLSDPWGLFTTNSVSFSTNVTSKTFSFVTAKKLLSVQAYNGGTGSTTVSFACTGNTTKTQVVAANTMATITTGFTTACTTVTVGSTNGWWTNFDNFIYN